MTTKKVSINITNCITKPISGKCLFFISGILLSFFLYNTFAVGAFLYVGLVLMFLSIVFLDCVELFLVAITLTPHIGMLKVLGSSFAIHSYYLLLIELKYFVIENKFKVKISIAYLYHVLSVCITFAIYLDLSIFLSCIRTVLLLVMISMLLRTSDTALLKKTVIDSYIYGSTINVILGILYYSFRSRDIFYGYFAGIRNDRNYFSTVLAIAISLIVLEISEYKGKELILKLSCLGVLLFGGLVSMSRTFIIMLLWSVLLILLRLAGKYKKRNILLLCAIITLLVFIFKDTLVPLIDKVLARFTDGTAVGGNGRFELWIQYISLTFSSVLRFLFGNGSAMNYVNEGIFTYIEHNTFIQMISSIGLMGSISLVACYVATYRPFVLRGFYIRKLVSIIPLVVVATGNFNISSLYLASFDISIFVSLFAAFLDGHGYISNDGVSHRNGNFQII